MSSVSWELLRDWAKYYIYVLPGPSRATDMKCVINVLRIKERGGKQERRRKFCERKGKEGGRKRRKEGREEGRRDRKP